MNPETLKLLIIDNNQAENVILQEAFIELSLPVTIEWIDSGQKAIAAFITRSGVDVPDVILVDFRLAGINGLEVIQALSCNYKLNNAALILTSGVMDDHLRKLCKMTGAFDALEKPKNFKGHLILAALLHGMLSRVKTERTVKP